MISGEGRALTRALSFIFRRYDMTDFETVLFMMLIPLYGVMFYIAGRMNLLELLLNILEEKAKEINNRQSDEDGGKRESTKP